MLPFTLTDLASMRAMQRSAMMDTCTIRRWTPTTDAFGSEVTGWVQLTGVPCGLDVTGQSQKERTRPEGTISVVQAVLRLTLEDGENLGVKDSIVITHRNGEALNPQLTYGVGGPVERGPTGVVVRLVEVS